MSDWVTAGDCYCILRTDGCGFDQQCIANVALDLLDFLNCLFLGQTVQLGKEISTIICYTPKADKTPLGNVRRGQHPRPEPAARDNIVATLAWSQRASLARPALV